MLTVAVIGIGVRGKAYSDIIMKNSEIAKVVALCDNNSKNLEYAKKSYGIVESLCYSDSDSFFKSGKLADILLVCTQDKNHFEHSLKAMELGYDLLIEKPISNVLDECISLQEKANALGRKVSICHELRYSFFCLKIKELIDSGELGSVVTINHTERVGYYHQAHSFVRGSWRNSEESSSMILAKCCHDLDLISFFAGEKCKSVSSFGSLSFFTEKNKPENSADYCYKCSIKNLCQYDAIKFYQNNESWANKTGLFFKHFNNENILEWLSDEANPYARCVFSCDNDVVDHQVVNMLFENNVCAHLTMTAFTNSEGRKILIYCTYGEIEGDMESNIITVRPFGKDPYIIDINTICDNSLTHGGGDKGLVEDFLLQQLSYDSSKNLTTIDKAIEGHKIAFAAEKSRINNGSIIELKQL